MFPLFCICMVKALLQDIIPCITLPHLLRQVSSCWIKFTGICLSLWWISYKILILAKQKISLMHYQYFVLIVLFIVLQLISFLLQMCGLWPPIEQIQTESFRTVCKQFILHYHLFILSFFFLPLFYMQLLLRLKIFSLNIFNVKAFQ